MKPEPTKKYTSMCVAIPDEVLNCHYLQEGDLVYCDYTPDGQTYFKTYCIIGTMYWEGACDPIYWIPSQRQLWDLYKGDWWSSHLKFNDWVKEMYPIEGNSMCNAFNSFEELLMEFIFHEVYSLRWTNLKWKKE